MRKPLDLHSAGVFACHAAADMVIGEGWCIASLVTSGDPWLPLCRKTGWDTSASIAMVLQLPPRLWNWDLASMVTLAGWNNQRCRQRASRVATAGGLAKLLCGTAVLATAVACSELDPGNESYCDINAGVGTCGTAGTDGGGPTGWWCLDQVPDELPPPRPQQVVGFALPVVEWGTRAPLAGLGLIASLCPGADFACTSPLNPMPIPVAAGSFGPVTLPLGVGAVPVPEGFDGFIKFDVATPAGTPDPATFISDNYYLGGTISGDMTQGQPILMIQKGLRQTIVQQSFPEVDAAASQNFGVLAFGVYDCDGKTVPDARIEINVAGRTPAGAIPFQLPNSRIPIAQQPGSPLYTGTSGLAGFLNVPPGTVQLTAYRRDSTDAIGSVQLGSVAGQLSIAPIRPSYVLDADITGAPQIEPAGATPTGG